MAYLIEAYATPPYPDARYPLRGSQEVVEFMDGGVHRTERRLASGVDEDNVDRLSALLNQKRLRIEEIEAKSASPALSDAEAVKLQSEDERLHQEQKELQAELSRLTDRKGRPRRKRLAGVDKVGSAIRRFLAQIKDRCPELHAHLTEAIESPGGMTPRYGPTSDISWEVQL